MLVPSGGGDRMAVAAAVVGGPLPGLVPSGGGPLMGVVGGRGPLAGVVVCGKGPLAEVDVEDSSQLAPPACRGRTLPDRTYSSEKVGTIWRARLGFGVKGFRV